MKNILVLAILLGLSLSSFGQLKVTTNGRIAAINTTSSPRGYFDIQQNDLTVPLGSFGMFGIQSLNDTNGFLGGNGAWRGGSIGYELYADGYGGLVQFATNRIMFRQTPQGLAGDAFVNNALINTLTLRDNSIIVNAPTSGTTAPYNLTVYGNAGKTGGNSDWIVFSDKRLKKNVKEFTDGLDAVLELNPVFFDYTGEANTSTGETYVGLIAQEMEKIAPYAVKRVTVQTDEVIDEETFETKSANSKEFLTLDNTAVRYMLVNAVQEQQAIIDEQNERISNLEKALDNLLTGEVKPQSIDVTLSDGDKAEIMQNVPNPFNGQTRIDYSIPNDVRNASIEFYNVSGQLIKSVTIDSRGQGSVNINADDLPSGTYSYSLVIDNKLSETKRMILSK